VVARCAVGPRTGHANNRLLKVILLPTGGPEKGARTCPLVHVGRVARVACNLFGPHLEVCAPSINNQCK